MAMTKDFEYGGTLQESAVGSEIGVNRDMSRGVSRQRPLRISMPWGERKK